MATRSREREISQPFGESLRCQPVVADASRVEAVGFEVFVAHRGDALQCADGVACHGGAHSEELQAELVAAAGLGAWQPERGGCDHESLLHEGSASRHVAAASLLPESWGQILFRA